MDNIIEITEHTKSTPTLCLNMIVKNESHIIKRLFDSVSPILDCYCICDTGSTDNTVELIETYFKEKNIPGMVVKEPFKNFCHNRNFALQSCVGMSDYVLLLDADMILSIRNFNKSLLRDYDSCTILQGNDEFYYQNMRIVRNNGKYSYSGVTHEYINTPSGNKNLNLDKSTLFINDIGDGGSKGNKCERDIKLLTEGLKEEPNNDRYYFYLANSYSDGGKYELAIENYKKRIELGGWDQEVWYSYYKMGLCYKQMGRINDAICTWLEGYNFYPDRIENLYEIVNHYRYIGKQRLSYEIYKIAKNVVEKNLNRDGYLFLHNDIYTSKLFIEYTIIAYYLGIKNIDNEVVKIMNANRNGGDINMLLGNMKFYKHKMIPKAVHDLSNKLVYNLNNEDYVFNSSSSCLIKNNKGGYYMNVRYVNYLIDKNGYYLNCDKHIITINKFVELDSTLNIISEKIMKPEFEDRRYIGIEDIKIYNDFETNKLLLIGTGYHRSNNIGIVTGDYDMTNCELLSKEIKSSFSHSDCEKNWIYVDYKDSTHVIYKWFPLNICKIDNENNVLNLVETKELPRIFSHVRGSTCGFKYFKECETSYNTNSNIDLKIYEEVENWFVVHVVSYEQPREYYHMIVVFDENMNLKRYTAPLKFEGECIEYCLSIVVDDNNVMINYSTWDRTTKIGVYDKSYIESLLIYV